MPNYEYPVFVHPIGVNATVVDRTATQKLVRFTTGSYAWMDNKDLWTIH